MGSHGWAVEREITARKKQHRTVLGRDFIKIALVISCKGDYTGKVPWHRANESMRADVVGREEDEA